MHSHSHAQPPAPAASPFGWSVWQRLAVVAGMLAVLWALVGWALAAA